MPEIDFIRRDLFILEGILGGLDNQGQFTARQRKGFSLVLNIRELLNDLEGSLEEETDDVPE